MLGWKRALPAAPEAVSIEYDSGEIAARVSRPGASALSCKA